MSKIYLIRHAKSEANQNEIFAGITDYPLCQEGLIQAEELKGKILAGDLQIDMIFSSPLSRTIQTITPTANALSKTIHTDKNLIEMNLGEWDGWTYEEIYNANKDIVSHILEFDEICGIKNQETHSEVAKRVYDEILKLAKQNPKKNLALVSHSIAIKSFLCKVLNIPFCEIKEKIGKIDNASISTLEFDENNETFSIKSLNK